MNTLTRSTVACACILAASLAPGAARAGVDGSVDASFGSPNGYVLVNGTAEHNAAGVPVVADVLSQPDGKVIVVGNRAYPVNGQNGTYYINAISVQRLLPDGSYDPSFGIGGISTIPSSVQGSEYYYATSATLDPNGRIAIAGYADNHTLPSQSMAMWVLMPSGYFDTSFGVGGMYVWDRDVDWSRDRANDIIAFGPRDWATGLDDEYAFALAGATSDDLSPGDNNSNPGPRLGVVKYVNANGSSFYWTSQEVFKPAITASGCTDYPLSAIASRVDMTGGSIRIYAAGTMTCQGVELAYAYKMETFGSWPQVLGPFGINNVSNFTYGYYDVAARGEAVAIDSAGRVIVAGDVRTGEGSVQFGIARLDIHGQFDPGFYLDGTREIAFTNSPAITPSRVNVSGLLIQGDGRILVGGDIAQQYIPGVFFAMRMHEDGSDDPTFVPTYQLSYTLGSYGGPRTWVDGAGWYLSPVDASVQEDEVTAGAMCFTQGERIVLAGSMPQRGFYAHGDTSVVMRINNDGIFSDGFGW